MRQTIRRRHYQPGLAPGTLVERERPPEEAPGIAIVDYTVSTVEAHDTASIDDIAPAHTGINRWIRVRGIPTPELMRRIGQAFSAHDLVLADIHNREQRIKVEDYDHLMYSVLRAPRDRGNGASDDWEIHLVLTKDTLITLTDTDDSSLFAPVLSRMMNQDSRLRNRGIDYLYYAIVDLVVDRFFPLIQHLEDRAADAEELILQSPQQQHLSTIHAIRGSTRHLRSNLWATRDLLSRIERTTHRFVEPNTLFYFRDIHDHVVHLLDAVSTLREGAGALMELYMSGVSNRMNETMKVLTIIATIFIPITFIAGVYGMNFAHMPELAYWWAYPATLALMAAIAIGMLAYFRRRKWI